ncbi:nectin-4-like isoform X2 [Saccostrea cucullata]|uniref:nectin-4-like isoform X2 n=1 Tax=Saccostrea cuccullata TaxID=36930 RepID=UPI002ED4BC86
MESDIFFSFILHSGFLYLYIVHEGTIAGTVSTADFLTATIGGSVDFTCTYTLDSGDIVYPGAISLQVKTGPGPEEFTSIAYFSPSGSSGSNSFTQFAINYKNRSELFNVTANGASAYVTVMRVNEVICSDEKHYRCSVLFTNAGSGPITKTQETSLTVRAPAEQPYDIPFPVPDNIEENMEVTLSCTANVGKPPGQIRWWRYRNGIIAPQEMTGVSSSTPPIQEGVCVYNVTSTVTYRMTKDDDQSVWRCFVENELLTMPDRDKPFQESKRVNVYFKVNVPIIRKVPDPGADSQYFIGSSVTLICEAEGNPTPGIHSNTIVNRYLWTFKSSPSDNARELSSSNGTLTLTNLQESYTGIYTCTAFNGFNGKFFNASNSVKLHIVKTTTTIFTATSSTTSSERTSKLFTTTPQEGMACYSDSHCEDSTYHCCKGTIYCCPLGTICTGTINCISIGTVAGSLVGGVVLIISCIVCCVCYRRRKHKLPASTVIINYGQQQIRINHEQRSFGQYSGQLSGQPHLYRQGNGSPPGYCR